MTPTQSHIFGLFETRHNGTVLVGPKELTTIANWPKHIPLPEDPDWKIATLSAYKAFVSTKPSFSAPPAKSVKAPRPSPISECQRLKIPFTPHPSNKGVTAMRATNALNAYLRRLK